MSEIEIKPSAKGDFLKTIKKETKKLAEILKNLQPKAFENYHKSKRKTSRNSLTLFDASEAMIAKSW